jgi:hypothetical protein
MGHRVMSERRVKVLYIEARGRSGSTLLGNVLGEIPGVFHAGELRTIWGQGLLHGRLCGCGEPVRECTFWQAVLGSIDVPPAARNLEAVFAWQREAVRLRSTPRLLTARPGRLGATLQRYVDVQNALYRSIGETTGCRMIVDTSKREADAALLGLLPDIDDYYLHLVRDPRAVAYSWQRFKGSPGTGTRQEMLRYSSWVSTRGWIALNLAAEVIGRRRGSNRSATLRYEDFVARPDSTVKWILRLVGEQTKCLPFVDDATLTLSPNHTAGGNPNRLAAGAVQIAEDNEWVARQSASNRLLVTLMALPLLHRYGYPIRVPQAR